MPLIDVTETTVDRSQSCACWVMSHDGVTAAELFNKPEGCTAQSKYLICGDSKQAVLNEATRLGIVVPLALIDNEITE